MNEEDPLILSLCKPGVHEKAIRERFGDGSVFDGGTPVFDRPLFVLGFSNRSGSNLLADYLRSTGQIGGLAEMLNHEAVANKSNKEGLTTFPGYIRHVVTKGWSSAKDFAFKASWDQVLMLLRLRIDKMFSGLKIIHITRQDVLSQAISMHIAFQTKRWTSKQQGSGIDPTYDQVSISHFVQALFTSRRAFAVIRSVFDIPTLAVTYEDLVLDPLECISRIARFCPFPLEGWRPPEPELVKQANEVTDEFRNRYRASVGEALLAVPEQM